MVALVLAQMVLADEALAAHGAGEGPHARVRPVVVDELGALGEALLALGAGEGPLARVQHAVADEMGWPREAAPAFPAAQATAVPRAATATAPAAAATPSRASARCPCSPFGCPLALPTAALVRTQADLQLEALSACSTGEGPSPGRRRRVLLHARLVAEALCPAWVLAGISEGPDSHLAGV